MLFPELDRVDPAEHDPALVALGARLPGTVHLGTSTWTFPGWVGSVWRRPVPSETLVREGLVAYGQHPLLRLVGVDRTFYKAEPATTWAAWAAQVPEACRFLVKAPGAATWREPRGAAGPSPHFLDAAWVADEVVGPVTEGLAGKLGALVFQFPPQALPHRFVDRLGGFLERLPRGPLYAVELRSPEPLEQGYGAMLAATGAVHCLCVHPTMPDLRTQWRLAGVGRGRALVGRWNLARQHTYADAKHAWAPFDRIHEPDLRHREQLARALRWAADRGLPSFLTVNNKAEGSAPLSVRLLAELFDSLPPGRPGA